jgi:NAD(P)H-hydrate epimerase
MKIYLTHDPEKITGDARLNYNILKNLNFAFETYGDFTNDRRTIFSGTPLVFVDALVGTGLKGELTGVFKDLINDVIYLKKYHNAKATVISADIPSGLDGDNGPTWPTIMPADLTVTFGCPKKGLTLSESKPYVGRLEVSDIGLPEVLLKRYQ